MFPKTTTFTKQKTLMFAEKSKQATIRASTYSIFNVVVVFFTIIMIIIFTSDQLFTSKKFPKFRVVFSFFFSSALLIKCFFNELFGSKQHYSSSETNSPAVGSVTHQRLSLVLQRHTVNQAAVMFLYKM